MMAPSNRERAVLWTLLLVGMAARAGQILMTADAVPHPDQASFFPATVGFAHPFDTCPREPAFVWWVWLLEKIGCGRGPGLRLATSLWFLPSGLLLWRLARPRLSFRWTAGCLAAFALWPAQVVSDGLGLRHLIETTGTLALLAALDGDLALARPRRFVFGALALAVAAATRISFLVSGAGLLASAALATRRLRPLAAWLPAVLILAPHFLNNRARTGDALHSINLHSYWYANLEYVGRAGFHATEEERAKDVYRPSLRYREWAYSAHTPLQHLGGVAVGYTRFFWTFFERVYFRASLPSALTTALMALWMFSLLWAVGRRERWVIPWILLVLNYPFAFVGHVFWAGRFFVPFAPLALLLMSQSLSQATAWARARRPSPHHPS